MNCPNETPEGQQVGIVKNLSLTAHITIQSSSAPVILALQEMGMKLTNEIANSKAISYSTKILVNGDWIGIIPEKQTHKIYTKLKILKRSSVIIPYASIAWNID